jgi:hypothetical protein
MVVLYRASELAIAAGYNYVQILDYEGSRVTSGPSVGSEVGYLYARGSNSPDAPTDCRTKRPNICTTILASALQARLGPQMIIQYK